jgi:hypothetical protein
LDKCDGGVVINGFCVEGANEADFVGDFCGVREEFREADAGVACGEEFEPRGDDWEAGLTRGHTGEALSAADGVGEFCAVESLEFWLFVEEFEVRGASGLKQIDDSICPRREMCAAGISAAVLLEERGSGGGAEE